mmetsp:Transcript_77005/g.214115  ORF Transcript_77005/g.214115 Transcript_77005/m.214115 type:complete len:206 (+) Transcript_77005:905-1522(+)
MSQTPLYSPMGPSSFAILARVAHKPKPLETPVCITAFARIRGYVTAVAIVFEMPEIQNMSLAGRSPPAPRTAWTRAEILPTNVNIIAGFNDNSNDTHKPLHNVATPSVRTSLRSVWKKPFDCGSAWFTLATTSIGVVNIRLSCCASMFTTSDRAVLSCLGTRTLPSSMPSRASSRFNVICTRIVCQMKNPTFDVIVWISLPMRPW